jgi:hypothetical protein
MQEYLEELYKREETWIDAIQVKPNEYNTVQEAITSVTEQLNSRQSELDDAPRKIEIARLRNDLETIMEETAKQPAIREIIPVLERMKRHAEIRFYKLAGKARERLEGLEGLFAELKKSIQEILTLRKNVETCARSVFSSNHNAEDEEAAKAIASLRGQLLRDYRQQEKTKSALRSSLNSFTESVTFLKDLAYPFEISAENHGIYNRAFALLEDGYAPQFIEQARADHEEYQRISDEKYQRAEEAERLANEEKLRQEEEEALAYARPWVEEYNHAHPDRQRTLARSKPDYVMIVGFTAQVTPGIKQPFLAEE